MSLHLNNQLLNQSNKKTHQTFAARLSLQLIFSLINVDLTELIHLINAHSLDQIFTQPAKMAAIGSFQFALNKPMNKSKHGVNPRLSANPF